MGDVKDASVCWPKARDMLARNHRAGQEPTYCEFADHVPYHKPSWYDCKKDCVKLLHDNRKKREIISKPRSGRAKLALDGAGINRRIAMPRPTQLFQGDRMPSITTTSIRSSAIVRNHTHQAKSAIC